MTSVIILNWNTEQTVSRSIDALRFEGEPLQIILVDNGSDQSFNSYASRSLTVVRVSENRGPSVGRNVGLQLARGQRIFLLDGDIEYVSGTIDEYKKVMDLNPHLLCLGQNNPATVAEVGHNGIRDRRDVDIRCPTPETLYYGFPMAWTQYGLFDGDFLRKVGFIAKGAFGEAGHGYEDDWLYEEIMMQDGEIPRVAYVHEPIYFHDAHSSLVQFQKKNMPSRTAERAARFHDRWGPDKGWINLRASMTIREQPVRGLTL